jgi:hypothetical protein
MPIRYGSGDLAFLQAHYGAALRRRNGEQHGEPVSHDNRTRKGPNLLEVVRHPGKPLRPFYELITRGRNARPRLSEFFLIFPRPSCKKRAHRRKIYGNRFIS